MNENSFIIPAKVELLANTSKEVIECVFSVEEMYSVHCIMCRLWKYIVLLKLQT